MPRPTYSGGPGGSRGSSALAPLSGAHQHFAFMAMDISSSDLISLMVTDDSSVTWNHGIQYRVVVVVA